jgi:hypothetical protein
MAGSNFMSVNNIMNMLYNFILEENEKLKKQNKELNDFVNVVEIACSHMLQDADVSGMTAETITGIVSFAKELQDRYGKQ